LTNLSPLNIAYHRWHVRTPLSQNIPLLNVCALSCDYKSTSTSSQGEKGIAAFDFKLNTPSSFEAACTMEEREARLGFLLEHIRKPI